MQRRSATRNKANLVADGRPPPSGIAQRRSAAQQVERVTPFLEKYGLSLKSFSWRSDDSHILIILGLAGLQDNEAATLFQDIWPC